MMTNLRPITIEIIDDPYTPALTIERGDPYTDMTARYFEIEHITPTSMRRLIRLLSTLDWSFEKFTDPHYDDGRYVILFTHPPTDNLLIDCGRYLTNYVNFLAHESEETA